MTLFEDNIKILDERNNKLLDQNKKLALENDFLKERHFQITQIKSILELNLFEIDTKFKRSICNQEVINYRDVKYFGTLSVSLKAKYGIDCKELRFKYDGEKDVLKVANINPKFLSFGNRTTEWDFFEIFEYRGQNLLADRQWMTSADLYKEAAALKEKYRVETENSLDKGPEEFSWIYAPIRQNIESAIRILFKGVCPNIQITSEIDDSFIPLEKLSFDNISGQKILKEHHEE